MRATRYPLAASLSLPGSAPPHRILRVKAARGQIGPEPASTLVEGLCVPDSAHFDSALPRICGGFPGAPQETTISEEVLARVRDGDTGAFGLLHGRHVSFAMGVAIAVTRDRWAAEDAVQEAFLALWRSADRYDPNRSSVTTWLAVIVRRRAIDQLRRRRLTSELPDGDGLPIALVTQDAWKEIAGRLDRIELVGEVAKLRATQRDALVLAFFGQLTHIEVADQLGLPLGTAKSRIRAGLRALRATIPAEPAGWPDAQMPWG